MKVHVVFNEDNDVIGVVEAADDVGFYTWLHVACPDIELGSPIEVETHDSFMGDLIDQRMLAGE